MAIGVDIRDTASPLLNRLREDLTIPRAAGKSIGRGVTQLIKGHLTDLDRRRPNRLGGPRTHFYLRAAEATNFRVTGKGVVISINQLGIRQRILGGTIVPRKARALTIPVSPEAYGKRAREFPDLVLIKTNQRGSTILARIGQGDRVEPLFVLKKRVVQKADPSVLPTEKEIITTARRTLGRFLQSRRRPGGQR